MREKKLDGSPPPSSVVCGLCSSTVHLCEVLTPIPRFLRAKGSEKAGGLSEKGNGGRDGSQWVEERKEAAPWPHTLSVSL